MNSSSKYKETKSKSRNSTILPISNKSRPINKEAKTTKAKIISSLDPSSNKKLNTNIPKKSQLRSEGVVGGEAKWYKEFADGTWLAYVPNVFDEKECVEILENFKKAPFVDEKSFYGNPPARQVWWCGDFDYTYSNKAPMKASPVPEWMQKLLDKARIVIQHVADKFVPISGSLNNKYRGLRDSVDWHPDAEETLMPDMPITSISYGGERPIEFRHIARMEKSIRQMLRQGSLMIMGGTCQKNWEHRIPKIDHKKHTHQWQVISASSTCSTLSTPFELAKMGKKSAGGKRVIASTCACQTRVSATARVYRNQNSKTQTNDG